MKKPVPTGLNCNLKIDEHDCKKHNIDLVLKDVKVKHWCDQKKLTKYCLKNKSLPLDSDSAVRMIINFFKKIQDAYKTNYALSEYAKRSKAYWNKDEYKDILKECIRDGIKAKKLELEIARSKNERYNMRRATKAKKEATKAAVDYQSSSFVHRAVGIELTKEERRISLLSSSSTESLDHTTCYDNHGNQENDNIFTRENQVISVATRIKEAAKSLHQKYVKNNDLTENEISTMSLGLSSILNIGNNAKCSQRSIFNEVEWSAISMYYKKNIRSCLPHFHQMLVQVCGKQLSTS